jgi:hypothetical protein
MAAETQEIGRQKNFFSKFFLDYIFYMSLYVGPRLREFLGRFWERKHKNYIFFTHPKTI